MFAYLHCGMDPKRTQLKDWQQPMTHNSLLFSQIRVGFKGKPFRIYKFRTMYIGAENDQAKYAYLNQGIPPTFKIPHDPRLTPVGRWLYQTGLDEIPQLWNVLKGEMAIIGPRPLPPNEHQQLPAHWKTMRESVKPGMISSWALSGSHNLTQKQWMELDKQDSENLHNPLYRWKMYGRVMQFLIHQCLVIVFISLRVKIDPLWYVIISELLVNLSAFWLSIFLAGVFIRQPGTTLADRSDLILSILLAILCLYLAKKLRGRSMYDY